MDRWLNGPAEPACVHRNGGLIVEFDQLRVDHHVLRVDHDSSPAPRELLGTGDGFPGPCSCSCPAGTAESADLSCHGSLHAKIAHLAALAHTGFSATQMLTALCQAAGSSMDVAGVGVMASDGLRTRFVDVDHPALLPLQRVQEGLQEGPCRDSIESSAPVAIADLGAPDLLERWPTFTTTAREAGMRSVLAVPLMARGRAWGTLDLYRYRTGEWSEQELTAAALLADVAVSYLVLAADRDTARVMQQELLRRSLHDELTGLPNRTLFTDRLEQALLTAHRHASAVAVLFIDLDRFKAVNDTFGHAGGDRVLVETARRMAGVMREGDTLARLAGDEFVIVCTDLPRLTPGVLENLLTGLTNRLQNVLSVPLRVDDVDLVVSASIGVAVTGDCARPRPSEGALVEGTGRSHVSADDLLREADHAMYSAKATGPGRVHLTSHDRVHHQSHSVAHPAVASTTDYSVTGNSVISGSATGGLAAPEAESTLGNHLGDACQDPSCRWGKDLGRDLLHALERGEFRVHYQPIVETSTRRVHAVEALLRWQHPRYGLLSAGDFLDLAIHTGQLPSIGRWALTQACADLASWRAQIPERPSRQIVAQVPERVFCNLSAVELADPHLSEAISAALNRTGLTPANLGLEIVEDDLAGPTLTPALQALHEAGHPLSIDDFGTGYSSLSRLVNLPVAVAKIDKAFITGLPTDPRSRALVEAVMVVAHSLGLQVIAEGVETPEQAAQVLACGCEYLQGHQESKPVSAEAMLIRLQQFEEAPRAQPSSSADLQGGQGG